MIELDVIKRAKQYVTFPHIDHANPNRIRIIQLYPDIVESSEDSLGVALGRCAFGFGPGLRERRLLAALVRRLVFGLAFRTDSGSKRLLYYFEGTGRESLAFEIRR